MPFSRRNSKFLMLGLQLHSPLTQKIGTARNATVQLPRCLISEAPPLVAKNNVFINSLVNIGNEIGSRGTWSIESTAC